MNYYIQGCAAKADKIKAAFKRLGIKAGGYDFSRKDVLFFTFEAKGKTYMMSSLLGTGLDNIILTHPNYKELELPKPHYDISNFHAGMPVLQRSGNDEHWDYNIFSRYLNNNCSHPFILVGCHSRQCIPFEGNEHLLGTTDPCDEQYINW